jgi:glycerol-3-phosphate O-acyltransferase
MDTVDMLNDGMNNLGVFHVQKPLFFDENGDIVSDDFHLLYYYHNRLTNYEIENKLQLKESKLELLAID